MKEQYTTRTEAETVAVARSFATRLKRGNVVALRGELGTGKTRFVKGICEAFKADHHVTSPSFIILNRYEGKDSTNRPLFLYHLDLYRVRSVEEIYDLGFEEFVYGENITFIEWSEQMGELLPSRRYDVGIKYGRLEGERHLTIELTDAPDQRSEKGRERRK